MAMYAKTAGGNWSAAGTWSATGAAGVDSVGPPLASTDVIFELASGAVTIDTGAVCRSIDTTSGTGTYGGTLTHTGSVTWNIGDGTAGAGSVALKFNSTMTYSPGSATIITFKSTSGTQQSITWGTKSTGSIVINGAGSSYILADNLTLSSGVSFTYTAGSAFDMTTNTTTVTLAGTSYTITPTVALTFYNLTVTPTSPSKTNSLTLAGNITVSNLFTVSDGATVTNRVLVQSNTVGTPRTITAASISISNADFMDITGAGAATWDMSAASGGSGNCGGNTMQALGTAAFTASADQHWTNASSSSWSTSGNWTSRVPLPQDNVFMDKAFGTSQTVTADMPRLGASIDWTGATWTTALTWTNSVAQSLYGSLTMISGLSLSGTNALTFGGRSAYDFDSKLITFPQGIALNAPSGSLTLLSNFTTSCSSGPFTITNGTMILNDKNVNITSTTTSAAFSVGVSGTVNLGAGTITIASPGTNWSIQSGSTITNATNSTVKFTDTTATAITIQGASKTFGNFWFSRGASTGSISIVGSNTFNDFKDDGTGAHSILFTAASTQTLQTFTVNGTNPAQITLNSTTTATYTLQKITGGLNYAVVSCDWLNIQHCIAKPAIAMWYAGVNSTSHQGDVTAGSGWIFKVNSTDPQSNGYSNHF